MNKNTNNLIIAIIVAGSTIAILNLPSVQNVFAAGDKCISFLTPTGSDTTCGTDKQSPTFSGDAKKECREVVDKCSSSQSGFGAYGNFYKP